MQPANLFSHSVVLSGKRFRCALIVDSVRFCTGPQFFSFGYASKWHMEPKMVAFLLASLSTSPKRVPPKEQQHPLSGWFRIAQDPTPSIGVNPWIRTPNPFPVGKKTGLPSDPPLKVQFLGVQDQKIIIYGIEKKLSTPGSKTNYLQDQKQIIWPGGAETL